MSLAPGSVEEHRRRAHRSAHHAANTHNDQQSKFLPGKTEYQEQVRPMEQQQGGIQQPLPSRSDVKAAKRARTAGIAQLQSSKPVYKAALKSKRDPNAAPRSLLSFGEELDDDEATSTAFSLAENPHHKSVRSKKTEHSRNEPCQVVTHPPPSSTEKWMLGNSHMHRPADPKHPGHMCFGVATTRGARAYMEDRHTVVASYRPAMDGISCSFAGVYDGHNGAKAAEHCCSRLHVVLASDPALRSCTGSAATQQHENQKVTAALQHAFRSIDEEILHKSRQEQAQDGSTGLILLRIGEGLYTAHCGDSRAVLCRAGRAVRLTQDHKPNLPAERERIRQVGGRIDFSNCWRVIVEPRGGRPGSGLAVSRSFGDLAFKQPCRLVECEPDINQWRLQEGDSFAVLASDGLWDVMSDQEAVDSVQKDLTCSLARCSGRRFTDRDARSAADVLVYEAVKKGTLDNVTVIVCLLPWN